MRKFLATALAVVACSASLTLSTASQAAAAGPPAQCVKVRKFFTKGEQRAVRLTNLCTRRPACYVIVVPHHADPRGRLSKGVTKDVSYTTVRAPRALYVKNAQC
ncbi:hypothetical protein [Streptomyces pinistramenti]|uniref:hypothetical protein n=1 Tax=Streptomyces pinistramenti TaxID=2884812 RepID=UPI001D088E33|nr:hypothetical protein [Streptomyces pinistramenti]MCB5906002.1 hypothetical protein [Streptomyces pinistramenti]